MTVEGQIPSPCLGVGDVVGDRASGIGEDGHWEAMGTFSDGLLVREVALDKTCPHQGILGRILEKIKSKL